MTTLPKNLLKKAVLALIGCAIVQAILAVIQVLKQGSIGLMIFVEPILGVSIDGVAKVDLLGQKIIRGYGTFPHPNILAFFLLAVLALIFLIDPVKTKTNVPHGTFLKKMCFVVFMIVLGLLTIDHYVLTSMQGLFSLVVLFGIMLNLTNNVCRIELTYNEKKYFYIATVIIGLGIIATFSRAILLSAVILIISHIWIKTVSTKFRRIQFTKKLLFLGLGFLTSMLFVIAFTLNTPAYTLRLIFIQQSFEIISRYPVLGVGLSQYVYHLPTEGILFWQYQPVHNIYLLIWAELGLIGLVSFLFLLYNIAKQFLKIDNLK